MSTIEELETELTTVRLQVDRMLGETPLRSEAKDIIRGLLDIIDKAGLDYDYAQGSGHASANMKPEVRKAYQFISNTVYKDMNP